MAQQWHEDKSEHFIVQYTTEDSDQWVRRVLYKAEEYYSQIAEQIGYPRYTKFWTWEDRVRIIIYADQTEYITSTGQPIWAIGGVQRDDGLFSTKKIVSFKQEDNFINSVLPHEISHLILHDYIGAKNRLPVWFDEGLAEIFEENKAVKADQFLRDYFKKGNTPLNFEEFHPFEVRREVNPLKVSLFYIQSVSVVDFMIKKYGNHKFSHFCKKLSEGNSFEESLQSAYLGTIDSITMLEKKWLTYME